MELQTPLPVLRVENVTKTFYSVKALDGVSFELLPGEVHALMGENGAGKSTLGKCITGIHKADTGTYFYKGKAVSYNNPKEALNDGIAIVLQEFNVLPHLSVAENIFLTDETYYKHGIIPDFAKMVQKTDEMLRYFHMREFIDPMEQMGNLTVAQMQIIEIIKAMTKDAKVIILDEPTATLSDREVKRLFEMVRELKAKGVAFVIVSHRINEIYEISDRITVLRDGKLVLPNAKTSELDEMSLIKAMVGRQIDDLYGAGTCREDKISDRIVLDVQHVSDTRNFVRDVSFQVREGEILGVSGLVGAGRTEMMRCIFGIDPRAGGKVIFKGKEIRRNSIRASIKAGMGFLSEKRKEEGLHQTMSILDNLNMVVDAVTRNPVLHHRQEEERCDQMVEQMSIKIGDCRNPVSSLSGGNQQKVLVGKWLLSQPQLLIVDEPTRGVDVASKSEIYAILRRLADQGISIIMISSEINEILGVSDRIMVVRDGKITGILYKKDATEERIGYYATIGNVEGEQAV